MDTSFPPYPTLFFAFPKNVDGIVVVWDVIHITVVLLSSKVLLFYTSPTCNNVLLDSEFRKETEEGEEKDNDRKNYEENNKTTKPTNPKGWLVRMGYCSVQVQRTKHTHITLTIQIKKH